MASGGQNVALEQSEDDKIARFQVKPIFLRHTCVRNKRPETRHPEYLVYERELGKANLSSRVRTCKNPRIL